MLNKYICFDLISILQTHTMDRAFSRVLHRCFFTHKKLQSWLNSADLPLSISYYRLLCKMLFRINVSIKKRKTHRRSYVLFMFFVIMHTCMLQKMCNCAPWGHTFWWIAEFGVTPATFSAFSPQSSVRLSF